MTLSILLIYPDIFFCFMTIKYHWSFVTLPPTLALMNAALASMLPPTAQPLSQQLREIASVTVAVVNLEYEGSVLPVTVRLR